MIFNRCTRLDKDVIRRLIPDEDEKNNNLDSGKEKMLPSVLLSEI